MPRAALTPDLTEAIALLRAAEAAFCDEPPRDVAAAEQALERASRVAAETGCPTSERARASGVRGNALRILGRLDEARAALALATSLDPDDADHWFDLGLAHKAARSWPDALAAFEQARRATKVPGTFVARPGADDERRILANVAIAATGAGRGDVASEVWRGLCLPARTNAAGMPAVDGLDPAEVRVQARGPGYGNAGAVPDRAASFEVLAVAPISPCHGVVASAAHRDGGVDYGDVVLWDAAPVSVARRGDAVVPRFPLLDRLRAGDERRLAFVALVHAASDVDALAGAIGDGALAFVHREQVEWVCPRCAAGDRLVAHEHGTPDAHHLVHGKLVLPASVALHAAHERLERWLRASGRVRLAVPGLYEALGDPRRAGQEHQAWRGIERLGR